jgi:hypothetical protein
MRFSHFRVQIEIGSGEAVQKAVLAFLIDPSPIASLCDYHYEMCALSADTGCGAPARLSEGLAIFSVHWIFSHGRGQKTPRGPNGRKFILRPVPPTMASIDPLR